MANDEVFTIGHSTHPIERFVGLLQRHGVELLADVRRFPGSRRNPQFNVGPLRESLGAVDIAYVPMGDELGGRRKPSEVAEGPAAVWRNDAFRGYAEYMETPEFAAGLERLEELARERSSAIMCAEALWWRCHRRLIADALVRDGLPVEHLLDRAPGRRHVATNGGARGR